MLTTPAFTYPDGFALLKVLFFTYLNIRRALLSVCPAFPLPLPGLCLPSAGAVLIDRPPYRSCLPAVRPPYRWCVSVVVRIGLPVSVLCLCSCLLVVVSAVVCVGASAVRPELQTRHRCCLLCLNIQTISKIYRQAICLCGLIVRIHNIITKK